MIPALIMNRTLGLGRLAPAMAQGAAWRLYSTGPDAEAVRSAEKLLDMMSSSPSMQQMMMASLPPAARNVEMVQRMLKDPQARQQIVTMIAKQGIKIPSHLLDHMTASKVEESMARASRMGINPTQLFQKLMAYPAVLKRLQEPHIMQAFLEIAQNPAAAANYADQPDTMEVVRKVQSILAAKPGGEQQGPTVHDAQVLSETGPSQPVPTSNSASSAPPPPPDSPTQQANASSSSPATSTPPPPATDPGLGAGGANPLLAMLMKDPALAPKLQNPRVLKALEEISKSPWKTVKYVLDKDVMEVFGALNKMLKR